MENQNFENSFCYKRDFYEIIDLYRLGGSKFIEIHTHSERESQFFF